MASIAFETRRLDERPDAIAPDGSRLWENAFAENAGWLQQPECVGRRVTPYAQARIACSSGAIPKIAITRFTL
jgi:hypothetical protein